ncbi:hypothetical protein [Mycobacterium colombiense]|uniref:hypothetical protein n=1 Tax=Mycobacterium colombiense TaxID=339268 RepID=UPI003AF7390F
MGGDSISSMQVVARARAASRASWESTVAVCRQVATSTVPGSGTVNAHPLAPSSSTRRRSMACRSSRACNMAFTSASITPAGACTMTVWLNCSTGPLTSCSQCMIGLAITGPTPSSTGLSVASATVATRASRATVCSTKTSRGRQIRPAARARATTCIDEMLSPPRSKKESSTPTRSSPSTCA